MDSILNSVKKMLSIDPADTHFDPDIIMHINSVFMILSQLGIGPAEGFTIEDEYTEWYDFIPEGKNLESVKTYIYQKVRLLFDPPANSSHLAALKESISEFEWRLNFQAELN